MAESAGFWPRSELTGLPFCDWPRSPRWRSLSPGRSVPTRRNLLTTSVGQWVMHDLRRTLYSHVQRLVARLSRPKQTGDLISRVTSDIDAIQSFIASGLLGVLIDILTLVGMVGVMFYINWRFTLIALSVAPRAVCGGLHLHPSHQESLAGGAQERGRDCFRDPGSSHLDSRGQGFRARRITNSGGWRKRAWRAWKSPCAPAA